MGSRSFQVPIVSAQNHILDGHIVVLYATFTIQGLVDDSDKKFTYFLTNDVLFYFDHDVLCFGTWFLDKPRREIGHWSVCYGNEDVKKLGVNDGIVFSVS